MFGNIYSWWLAAAVGAEGWLETRTQPLGVPIWSDGGYSSFVLLQLLGRDVADAVYLEPFVIIVIVVIITIRMIMMMIKTLMTTTN